jgi:hypothetical protein
VQRVLDLDVDFFLDGFPAHHRPFDSERLDAEFHPPWTTDRAVEFLSGRCRLQDRLPGWVVEHHGQLFPLWRDAIDAGVLTPPFQVTHVDAHADLGLGDSSYVYLMTDVLFRAPGERRFPRVGDEA